MNAWSFYTVPKLCDCSLHPNAMFLNVIPSRQRHAKFSASNFLLTRKFWSELNSMREIQASARKFVKLVPEERLADRRIARCVPYRLAKRKTGKKLESKRARTIAATRERLIIALLKLMKFCYHKVRFTFATRHIIFSEWQRDTIWRFTR